MKISFSIKTEPKKAEPPKPASIFKESSLIDNDSDDEFKPVKKFAIRGFQNGEVDGEKESDNEVVIDLCEQKNDWKIQKLRKRLEEEGLSDEEKARILIILESMGDKNGVEGDDNTVIEKANDIEESNEDADYSKVKVKDFGMALLRGCGWKKGEGIGKEKKVVNVVIPKIRPKGLGLGADINVNKKKVISEDGKTIEELELKKGCFVKILNGRYTGRYGTVENLNVDLVRVYVKLTLGGNKIDISQFNVEVVSKSEHEKYGKILNKEKYEKVKYEEEKEEEKGEEIKLAKKRKSHYEREHSKKELESDSDSEDKYKRKRKSRHEEYDKRKERRRSRDRSYRRSRH
uniref:G-patch domain-containing protein n=1 Tax=Strongyloides stercoralis TaxID=6248 RepID=A0A0K0EE20_STRER